MKAVISTFKMTRKKWIVLSVKKIVTFFLRVNVFSSKTKTRTVLKWLGSMSVGLVRIIISLILSKRRNLWITANTLRLTIAKRSWISVPARFVEMAIKDSKLTILTITNVFLLTLSNARNLSWWGVWNAPTGTTLI